MAAQSYADAQLRRQLQAIGVDVGPITDTTRTAYQRMLVRKRKQTGAHVTGNAAKRPRLEDTASGSGHPVAVARRNPPDELVRYKADFQPSPKRRPPEARVVRPGEVNKLHFPSRPTQKVNICSPLPREDNVGPNSSLYPSLSPFVSPPRSPSQQGSQRGNFSHYRGNEPPSPQSPLSPLDGGIVSTVTGIVKAGWNVMNKILASPRPPLHGRIPLFKRASESASPSPSKSRHRDTVPIDEVDLGGDDSPGPSPAASPKRSPSSSPHHEGHLLYDWELLPSDVEICKTSEGSLWRLGKGGFGEVFKGLKDGADEVAVKVIRIQTNMSVIDQFKQEIDMISKLRHRHILQFYGACIKPSCLYMVTELMDTDLFTALRNDIRYQWTGIYGKGVAQGIASGLHYLHSRRPPVVHRDVKSPNVLLMDGIAKIADVGIARTKAASDMTAQRGFTIAWAAPEVVYRKRATEKIDIWSFGIILWEIVSGSMPRPGRLVLPSWVPTPLRELYSQCTEEDPANRPSAAELIQRLKAIK